MRGRGPIERSHGFNLIELMVTIVIISILAAVALPSYRGYVTKSNRTDGTSALLRLMDLQERYFSNQFPPTYTDDLTNLGLDDPQITENEKYSIEAAPCAGSTITNCVLLTATALNDQVSDGNLTLNSLGEKFRGGNPGWD